MAMDPIIIVIMLAIMLVLLLLAGWFAGSETALTNLSSGRLARIIRENRGNSKYLINIKKNMDRNLVTILVLNNIVNILLSSIAALFADALFDTVGVSLMVGLITFLIIVFGEIVPKSIAMIDVERVSIGHSKALFLLNRLLSPLMFLIVKFARLMVKLRGKKIRKEGVLVSDQDIKDLVNLGEQEGTIKVMERDIINKVFNFGDSKVRDAMVPMEKVYKIDDDIEVEEAKDLISSSGYTRVPIIDDEGKIIGLIYSKDLLGKKEGKISTYTRDVFILPGDMDLTRGFGKMKERRIHLAIVTDTEGNHIGIITLEDMIEEIVGEIYDEYFMKKGFLDESVKNKEPSASAT
jgi:CBS domain containing-hemolysin-like protein